MARSNLRLGGILVLLSVVCGCNAAISYGTVRSEAVTVQRLERVSCGKSSRYQVWTDKGVYQITDDVFRLKFDSANRYGALQPNKTYNVKVNGFRIEFLSSFPNVIEAQENQR